MTIPKKSTDIAIVGGGPVGLMLALFLDRHGVRSVVFNLEPSTRWFPKGNTHNARTMEHMRRLGISSQVRKLGLPHNQPTDVAYFTRFNAHELARIPMLSGAQKLHAVANSAPDEQVLEPTHCANQMYVERFLFDFAKTRPNITLKYGWQATDFVETPTGVSVEVEQAAGSAKETWTAQYLVGADGGRSMVRRKLGVRYEGMSTLDGDFFWGEMIATYVRAPALHRDFLGNRRGLHYWAVNPELRSTVITLDGADEWMIHTQATGQLEADGNAAVQIVQACAGANIPVEYIGSMPWTAGYALVAENFGKGRVWLAGDATHLFTPSGGFGMNTGVDGAANLSWKLAAMVQGWGGPRLMETYQVERRPVAKRNTAASRGLAVDLSSIEMPASIEDNTPQGALARQQIGATLGSFREMFASIGVQLGARYDESPIIVADEAPPADDYAKYVPSAVPGGRAPHLWLAETRGLGDSLFDRLGVGFTLLNLAGKDHEASTIKAAAAAKKIPLKVLDIDQASARDIYQRDFVLIRPDQHVAWRGNRLPDPAATLSTLVGA